MKPLPASLKYKVKSPKGQSRHEAFLATAGSLKGFIDPEQLKSDIAESRRIISDPPKTL